MNGKRYLLDTNCCLATALVNGCAVISNDEHFQRQSKVEVTTYTL